MGSFESPPMGSQQLPMDTYGLALTDFGYLTGSKSACVHKPVRTSVRPSAPDKMTNTAPEAILSRAAKGVNDTTDNLGITGLVF